MSFCERMFWVLLVKMGLLLMFFRIFSNTFVKIALIMRILCIFPSQNIPRKILKEKGPGLRSLYSTWSPKNEQNHYKLYIWRRERERESWRLESSKRNETMQDHSLCSIKSKPFWQFPFFFSRKFWIRCPGGFAWFLTWVFLPSPSAYDSYPRYMVYHFVMLCESL